MTLSRLMALCRRVLVIHWLEMLFSRLLSAWRYLHNEKSKIVLYKVGWLRLKIMIKASIFQVNKSKLVLENIVIDKCDKNARLQLKNSLLS